MPHDVEFVTLFISYTEEPTRVNGLAIIYMVARMQAQMQAEILMHALTPECTHRIIPALLS